MFVFEHFDFFIRRLNVILQILLNKYDEYHFKFTRAPNNCTHAYYVQNIQKYGKKKNGST